MEGADSVKDVATSDRDNDNKSIIDEVLSNDQQILPRMTRENSSQSRKNLKPSSSKIPANPSSFRGPFGITIASGVVWYICICLLFIIAFLSLILSLLYFITETTTEQVIKLYGICGSGTLLIITVIIVCLDCCNDRSKKDHEQETMYKIVQEKKAKEKAMALRRSRRIAEGKEKKPKPFVMQHQRPQQLSPEHHHSHHVHVFPPTSYHHPFVCPVCHDLHASGNARHNLTDVAVDTSDKFAPVSKSEKIVHKSTRDAQTEPKLWDAERGTQTDRTEGTQTSSMELSGMPSNVTQIIHETTILKAPRSLLSTLKKSMLQQDKDVAIHHAVTDTNTTNATII